MDVLVYSIAGQKYGLDLTTVNSVVLAVEITNFPNLPEYFCGAINVHGEITLVLDMRKLLAKPVRELDVKDQFILCNIHQKQVALWVDHVDQINHINEEELMAADRVLPELNGIQYVIKEMGQLILVYNLEKLLPPTLTYPRL